MCIHTLSMIEYERTIDEIISHIGTLNVMIIK